MEIGIRRLHHVCMSGIADVSLRTLCFGCHGVHRRCLHRGDSRRLRRSLIQRWRQRALLRQALLRPQERHSVLRQGPHPDLRPQRQPRAVHAGVEPHRQPQVRDPVVPAPAVGAGHRQAGGLHDPAEADPVPGVRPRGHGVAHQQLQPRVLRRAVLDDVEAAHVRVPGRVAGAEGDPGVQDDVPAVLCAHPGLRQHQAGADRGVPGRHPRFRVDLSK